MSGETPAKQLNAQELMQEFRDRLKLTFASIIPDDQWDEMCKKEINDFFTAKDRGYNHHKEYASDFQLMIRNCLSEDVKARIMTILKSPDYESTWDNNGVPTVSKKIEMLLIENSGAVLANAFGGMMQGMLVSFQSQLRNGQMQF